MVQPDESDTNFKRRVWNMDIFFAYLLIGTATPIFLWLENRKIALLQIPLIALMWTLLGFYLYSNVGLTGQIILGSVFVVNIIAAHLTVLYVLYTSKLPEFLKSRTDEGYIH